MGKTTQDGRILSIATPLGKDFLLLERMKADEALSELFRIDVELLHEETSDGLEPTIVDAKSLLGQSVTIAVNQADGVTRLFNGIVSRFSQGNRDNRFTYYYATIVPQVWILTQRVQSRIFQHISVPDILRKIFAGFEVAYEMQGNFEPRNFCVQYRESDFDFASRLMEEEGIFYYFEHKGATHKMIIANTPGSHRECPEKSRVTFRIETDPTGEWVSEVGAWRFDYQLQTGKVTLWDHNFELPNKKLEVEEPTQFNVGGNQKLEVYDFPGGYARWHDGIDRGGGERPSDLQKIFTGNKRIIKVRMEELDAQYKTANGISTCASLTAGHRFKLDKHPTADTNGDYVLTNVTHEARQSPGYISNEIAPGSYGNGFTCIPYGKNAPTYRPALKTARPVLHGSQTAMVVGPAGEEIFTDKYGRVKVQFHWDRESKADSDSSCWMRVAQGWAGKKWGMMFIPRVGMEVIVHFVEGDPDRPIITGCVYNPDSMPPYTLPDEKTKSTMKSNSSKGGSGFNEFRFEDKKGEEQIFIHAEKDFDARIKNDRKEIVKSDSHLIVEKSRYEKIKSDTHLSVTGDQNEKVDGSTSLKVGTSAQIKTGMKYAVDAGMEVHLKAGMTAVIEAGMSLTLKVGGNFININPAGVFIQGTMVMINSGGAATSGSGSSPTAPTDPKEAVNADSGNKVKNAPPPPPKKSESNSQKSQAVQNAANKGQPFVSGSSKPTPPKPKKTESKKAEPKKPSREEEQDKKIKALEEQVDKLEQTNKKREADAEAEKKQQAAAERARQQKAVDDANTVMEAIMNGVDPDALKAQKEFVKRRDQVDKLMKEREKLRESEK